MKKSSIVSQPHGAETPTLRTVLWRRADPAATEICRLRERGGTFRLEGTVLLASDGAPAEVAYQLTCNRYWETEAARIAVRSRGVERTVDLRREQGDLWFRDGVRIEEMDGTTDLDLGFTPATNTLPIRRLSLGVGRSASVSAAWLGLPDLRMEVLAQRYTRLDESRYHYETGDGAFAARIAVDDQGLVVRYEGAWQRIAEWPAASPALERRGSRETPG